MNEIEELLEKVVEALYQKVEGYCPWCSAKDYPVCGDKRGYEEVKAEDAEEWQIDHSEDCIVVYLDQALALLREKPEPTEFLKECPTCGEVVPRILCCPECGRDGCWHCMPAGIGCICPECEEDIEK